MAAKNDSGQSILELLFLLPMLVGLTVILIRVNTAIQVSIVNQQYSRAMIFFSNMNSPNYPSRRLLSDSISKDSLVNQMVFGVSDVPITASVDDNDFEASTQPIATTQYVARVPKQGSDERGEVTQRGSVRIRNTVTLCGPTVGLRTGRNQFTPLVNNGTYQLNETTEFDFCGSTLTYE